MAGPWLYPIAKKAGRVFELDDGSEVPVSLENFRKLVQNGKLTQDEWWYIKQNWRHIEIGDEVFIYTGDEDYGIIGYATVKDMKEKYPGDWYLQLDFDLGKCQALLKSPIPAPVVRKWVHYPQKTVINFDKYDEELQKHLPWRTA